MQERLSKINNLQSAILPIWTLLKEELMNQRQLWLEQLVVSNDEQVRGRIKAIDYFLELPDELQQEAIALKRELPDEDSLGLSN